MKVMYTNQKFDPTLEENEVETIFELKQYVNSCNRGSYMVDEYTGHFGYNWLIEQSGIEDELVDHIDYFILGGGKVDYKLTEKGEFLKNELETEMYGEPFNPFRDL